MTRDEKRRQLLEMMPKGGVCAEIGVWDGNFSEEILKITTPSKLHLIDPWLFQPEFRGTGFGRKANEDTMDGRYEAVCDKFKDDGRVEIHRALRHDALETFEDGSIDWVYIDGNHTYEVVKGDIALSLQKVKPNGIISGDDFWWRGGKGAPVRTAVREFAAELGDKVDFSRIGQQWILKLARETEEATA